MGKSLRDDAFEKWKTALMQLITFSIYDVELWVGGDQQFF
jgi:hypothetical protein